MLKVKLLILPPKVAFAPVSPILVKGGSILADYPDQNLRVILESPYACFVSNLS